MKKILLLLLSLFILGTLNAKTLKMSYDADPVSLDPHEQLSGGTLQLSHLLFDPLIRWNQAHKFDGRLANKWKQINALTIRFNLRKDVRFHSGNRMTSKDVKWTFDRIKRSPDFKAVFAPIKDMKVKGKYTIDVVTHKPYPLALSTMTYIFVMDSKFYSGKDSKGKRKDRIEKNIGTFASTTASGTGPFIVTSRQQGVELNMKRFKNYWDKKSPGNVTKIEFRPISTDVTRVSALLSGDVDFIAPVPTNDIPKLRRDRNINLVEKSGTRVITFQLNQKRRKEFRNKKVRQAIAYAINNKAIVKKIMKNFATAAGQQSPKGYYGYNSKLKPRYSLTKAKQLMKEAGYAKGFSISMMAPNNRYVNDEKIAQAVASMLAKIKIKANLKTLPKAQYWGEFDKRVADMMMIGWHSDTEDSANFTEYLLMTPNKETGRGQYNSGNYSNPRVDKLVEDSNKEINVKKRAKMLQQVEKILYDDAAFIPLHWQNLAWAAKKGVMIEKVVNQMNFPYLGDLVIK